MAVVRQFKIKVSPTSYSDPYDIGSEARNVRATIDIPRMEQPRIVDTNTIITELNNFRLKFYEEGCFYTGAFSDAWPYTAVVDCPGLKTDDPFFLLVGPMLDIETETEGVFVDTEDTIVENLTNRKINFSMLDDAICNEDDKLILTSYIQKPDPFNFYIRLYSGTQTVANLVTIGEQNLDYFGKLASELISRDALIDTRGNVFGTVKYINDYSGYSSTKTDQKGYYVPIRIKSNVSGTNMTLVYNNQTIAQSIPFNNQIVAKIKDKTDTFTIFIDGKELCTLDFSNIKFVQPEIYDNVKIASQQSEWFGKHGSDFVNTNGMIKNNGDVIGTVYYVNSIDGFGDEFGEQQGNFLPINILANGETMTIIKNGEIIEENVQFYSNLLLQIDSKSDIFEVEIDGKSAFILNFKDADLQPADFDYLTEDDTYLIDNDGNYLIVNKIEEIVALIAGNIVLSADGKVLIASARL